MASVKISVNTIVSVFRTNQMKKHQSIGTVSLNRKHHSILPAVVALEHYLFIRVFDVLIITEEAPDSWLVFLDNEVEDDHGQGEPSDHTELNPSLDNHIPGLGYHSRHPDVFVLFLSLSFDEAYERASLLT